MANVFAQKREDDPHLQLIMLGWRFMHSACLHSAARLKIADMLAAGPLPVTELAGLCHVNEDALYRILRAITSLNVFQEVRPRTFANTALSEAMRSDIADSARDTVLFQSSPSHMRPFTELLHSVQSGETAFKKAMGVEVFEFFQKNPAEGQAFNAAMTSISAHFTRPIIEAYDFGESGTLADIGGGHGMLLTTILQKHPGLHGIVFDLPHVVSGARTSIESAGLASRCKAVGGSFFDSVVPADNYVLKSVIHDWDDDRAVAILKNCAAAMRGPAGRVILIELMIGSEQNLDVAKWLDVDMMVMAGGRERTESEFASLLAKAGLRLSRVVRGPVYCGIEGVKD